jgi:uncharacterized iron-regulated membrane protein
MKNPRATRSAGFPLLKTIHTWVGLISGLFLSVIALTGSVILFRAEFERVALPQRAAADASRHACLEETSREIAKLRPDSHVRRVRLPDGADDAYLFQIEDPDKGTERIVSDPSTGRVLGAVQPGWIEWMVDLHRNLLAGKQGRKTVGGAGVVLFVLSATGLLMWLRGARNWRSWISVRRQGSARRFNYELHRASGLWAYAFLAVISFTGVELAYPDTFRQAVQALTGKPATVAGPKKIKSKSSLSLDEYLRLGRAAMPDGVAIELRLPESGKGPVDLRLYRAGDLSPSGNHVYLNPDSGAVIMIDRIVDRPIGARFLAALSPIHYAQFGGMPFKIAWALLGLTPALLFATGLIAWFRPKSKSSRPAPEEVASQDVALARR